MRNSLLIWKSYAKKAVRKKRTEVMRFIYKSIGKRFVLRSENVNSHRGNKSENVSLYSTNTSENLVLWKLKDFLWKVMLRKESQRLDSDIKCTWWVKVKFLKRCLPNRNLRFYLLPEHPVFFYVCSYIF